MVSERVVLARDIPDCDDWERREESLQISRARSGDAAAINWLLSRYRQRVVRLAAHILRRPDEAEDIAQEAFIRAFKSLHRYRGDGRFYTWLYQIVVRICIDKQRLSRWDSEIPVETVEDTLPQVDPRIDETVLRLTIEQLLDQLSPPMRAMIVLRELEGLEYEEIARVLEIPVGRVRWRLHAARAQFHKLLGTAMKEAESV
jgi:RNA polymerase sigma-70 factor (ECF subfamily)